MYKPTLSKRFLNLHDWLDCFLFFKWGIKKAFKSLQHCKNVSEIFYMWTELLACSFNLKEARSRCPDADLGVFVIDGRGLFSQSRGHLRAFHQSNPAECLYRANIWSQVFLIFLEKLRTCSPAAAKNNFWVAVTKVAFPVFANAAMVTSVFMMHMSWPWKWWPCKKYPDFTLKKHIQQSKTDNYNTVLSGIRQTLMKNKLKLWEFMSKYPLWLGLNFF